MNNISIPDPTPRPATPEPGELFQDHTRTNDTVYMVVHLGRFMEGTDEDGGLRLVDLSDGVIYTYSSLWGGDERDFIKISKVSIQS